MAEAADEEIGDRAGIPRPRETATLIGHGAAEAAFAEGIAAGRLHHAWLIGGPRASARDAGLRVARRLLAYPQGTGPAGLAIPDNHPIHGQVAGLSHPNLVAVAPSQGHGGQDPADEDLRRHGAQGARPLRLHRTDSGWRICVVDSAEDLNANAANALLKVLEEPPPRALFLILAHQPGRLADDPLPLPGDDCAPWRTGRWGRRSALPPPFAQPEESTLARASASRRARSAGRSASSIPSPPASWRRSRPCCRAPPTPIGGGGAQARRDARRPRRRGALRRRRRRGAALRLRRTRPAAGRAGAAPCGARGGV